MSIENSLNCVRFDIKRQCEYIHSEMNRLSTLVESNKLARDYMTINGVGHTQFSVEFAQLNELYAEYKVLLRKKSEEDTAKEIAQLLKDKKPANTTVQQMVDHVPNGNWD